MPDNHPDFEAAMNYRDQFTFGTAEEEAVTGLINLLTANDTFTYARRWRIHRSRDVAADKAYEEGVSKAFETYHAECAESRATQSGGDQ